MATKIGKTFMPQEESELARLIKEYGVDDWSFIARNMSHKSTVRQWRERWKNYLDPRLHHCSWTVEEDRRLMREFNRMDPRWIPLSLLFAGRSGNAVRNRVFLLRRRNEHYPKESSFPIPILTPPFSNTDLTSNVPLHNLPLIFVMTMTCAVLIPRHGFK
jgi:hypothetical protein